VITEKPSSWKMLEFPSMSIWNAFENWSVIMALGLMWK